MPQTLDTTTSQEIESLHATAAGDARPEQNINVTLADLRRVKDARERLGEEEKRLIKQEQALTARLLDFHEASGLEKLTGGGLSVSFDGAAMRAKYDPEHWAQIVRWAVQTGNEHIVQRRLTDTKVIELVEGGIAMPEGLSLEPYTKISIRRV